MARLLPTRIPGIERINIKPQVDKWVFPDGHAVIVLSEEHKAEAKTESRR